MSCAENLIKCALDSYGQLDILVNSVGVISDRMIYQMTPSDWDIVIRNNVKGVFAPS